MERLGSGDEPISERYARHLQLKEIGAAGQQKLQHAAVLLVGVGGLGSPVALYLAAAGVGRIGLVDDDRVSLSNLQRQVLYTEDQVGLLKVECARKRLLQANSQMQIDCYPVRLNRENAAELIRKYDLVIDGCDNFATRYLMDDVCREQSKPYVYGSIGEFHGQLSVFHFQGAGSYRDLFPEEESLSSVLMPKGVMGVVPGVVGCMQAAEVVKIITGAGKTLANQLLTIHLLTMEIQLLSC